MFENIIKRNVSRHLQAAQANYLRQFSSINYTFAQKYTKKKKVTTSGVRAALHVHSLQLRDPQNDAMAVVASSRFQVWQGVLFWNPRYVPTNKAYTRIFEHLPDIENPFAWTVSLS